MSNQDKPFSFNTFVQFFTNNGVLLGIVTLFFLGGFFFGSAWTQKQPESSVSNAPISESSVASETAAESTIIDFSNSGLQAQAVSLGADQSQLTTCLQDPKLKEQIQQTVSQAEKIGIGGTPSTVLVVDTVPVRLLVGALPVQDLKTMVAGYASEATAVTADPSLAEFIPVNENDHRRGAADARIVLVEYSDYQCPYCKQFHPTLQQILAENTEDVAWVYRHYPLVAHPQAQPAAEIAECLAKTAGQDAFWQYTDSLLGS